MQVYTAIGLLFLSCSALVTATHSLHLLYDYESDIKTAADFPKPAASLFTLNGRLSVQLDDVKATLQLSDLSTSLYNGDESENNGTHRESIASQDQVSDLAKPFTIHLKDYVVLGLTGTDGEGEWSVNIKRAIASLFQLNYPKLNQSAFITKERGLYGECDVEYNVQHEDNTFSVRKYTDHTACSAYPSIFWSNSPPIEPICAHGHETIISSTSGGNYKVEDGIVKFVEVKGVIQAQPFKAKGELQYIATRQTLTYISSAVSTPVEVSAGKLTDLIYRPPTEADFTQGRAPLKQSSIVAMIKRMLVEITETLDKPLEKDPSKLHDERLSQVIFFLTILERKSLDDLFNEFSIGTSYQEDTIRQLFLQILPLVGTTHSILLIRDVIIEKQVDSQIASVLLEHTPFYLRHPSEELLRNCEVFYSLDENEYGASVRQAGILAFSTLVYKICKGHCSPQQHDKYVRIYLDRFEGTDEYLQKMVYLEGLNNMENGKVFDYLIPIIKSNSNHHLRFLAVWATMNTVRYHPNEVFTLYWPILSNRTEPLEMRVAALTMLVVSQPTAGRFFSLHWFMTTETDQRLSHFYYTTLLSLVNTKDPCYSLMSIYAAQVLRLLPVPSVRHWATGNYIIDQGDDSLGIGGMAQLFLIANQKTELPNVLYLLLGDHAISQRFNQISIYLKLEGVSDAIKESLGRIDPDSNKIPQVANILRRIREEPSTAEPLHVELIIQIEGRVTNCFYANKTTIDVLTLVVKKLNTLGTAKKEFHLNLQFVDNPLLNEHKIPTHLGTSALYLASVTAVSSFRGNTSLLPSGSKKAISFEDFEIRLAATAINSLVFYNPVLDIWHGVQRSTAVQLSIPLDGLLEIDTSALTIKLNHNRQPDANTELLTHVRSVVYVWGTGSAKKLRTYCESCEAFSTVSRGKQYRQKRDFLDLKVDEVGLKLRGQVFDCEHHNGLQVIDAAAKDQNFRVFPASRPIVVISHLIDRWLLISPPGSCGTLVKLSTNEKLPTELEGLLKFSSKDSQHTVSVSLTHKSNNKLLHNWEVDATCQRVNNEYNLTVNALREVPNESRARVCVEAQVKVPISPTDKLLVKASDPLNAEANFYWSNTGGTSSCGGEPADELPIQVQLIAKTTNEQAAIARESIIWPFNACKAGNVKACHSAAHEMSTLRSYTAYINYSTPIEPALLFLGRGSDDILVVGLEVPQAQPVVQFTIGTDEFTVDTGRHWIEPLLINTHYPFLEQIALSLGIIHPPQN